MECYSTCFHQSVIIPFSCLSRLRGTRKPCSSRCLHVSSCPFFLATATTLERHCRPRFCDLAGFLEFSAVTNANGRFYSRIIAARIRPKLEEDKRIRCPEAKEGVEAYWNSAQESA